MKCKWGPPSRQLIKVDLIICQPCTNLASKGSFKAVRFAYRRILITKFISVSNCESRWPIGSVNEAYDAVGCQMFVHSFSQSVVDTIKICKLRFR